MKDHTFDLLISYEMGDTSEEENLTLFAELVKTGEAWSLQGRYGRIAKALVEEGKISPQGEILQTT